MVETTGRRITLQGWMFIVLLLISGTAGSLIYKQMCLIAVEPGEGKEAIFFDHTYLMTLFMYIGQALNIIIIAVQRFVQRYRTPRSESQNAVRPTLATYLSFFMPTVIDVIGSTLYNVSMRLTLVSVCQMMRNCTVAFVAAFSAISFKSYRRHFDLPQLIGLIMVVVGMIAICLVSYFRDGDQESAPNNILGVVVCIVSTIFSSAVFVIEEALFGKIAVTGMQAVFSEGSFGCTIYLALIFTLNTAVAGQDGQVIEDLAQFGYQLDRNRMLIVLLVAYICSVMFYAWSSLETTKRVNAVSRSMFDGSKTLLIWLFSLIFGWERVDFAGISMKLAAYVVVYLGVIIYNRVVRWVPYLRKANREGFTELEKYANEIEMMLDPHRSEGSDMATRSV